MHYLENLRDSSGTVKFPILSAFMKCVLSISHGKSALESGFSINKHIRDIHEHFLKEDTIEALRVVKDAILCYPTLLDIPVTKEMLQNVKTSRQKDTKQIWKLNVCYWKEKQQKREKKNNGEKTWNERTN